MLIAICIVQVISSLFLIAVVLLQSGKSAGLSSALSGNSDTFLSKNKSKSLDVRLAKMTKWVAILFAVLVLALNLLV